MAIRVPVGLDERIFENFQQRDPLTGRQVESAELTAMAVATRAARDEATSLVALEAAVFRDTTRSEAARALKVAEAANKSGERVTAQLDAARAKVLASIEREEKLTAAPPPPITTNDVVREGQIRARLAGMSEKERGDVIADAFATRKMSVVAAVLHADAFESGIGEAKLASLRHTYREAAHPGVFERTKRLRDALDAFERAGNLFVGLVQQAAESDAARLAASNAERAQEALAAHGAR